MSLISSLPKKVIVTVTALQVTFQSCISDMSNVITSKRRNIRGYSCEYPREKKTKDERLVE